MNMSEREALLAEMVREASGIVAATKQKVGIRKAMDLVGFSVEEQKNMKLYQQVRRSALKVTFVYGLPTKTPPAAEVHVRTSDSQVSALSSDERNVVARNVVANVVARRILENTPSPPQNGNSSTASSSSKKKAVKVPRRTSKDVQRMYASRNMRSAINTAAMKAATIQIASLKGVKKTSPEYKSMERIVKETNDELNSNLNPKTVGRYVRGGRIGTSPLKTGPVGDFPKRIYISLMGAYSTYLKLEQSDSKKQSSIKVMKRLVNACVNKAGFKKIRDDLTRKLQRDTAEQFDVAKANVVEYRRMKWTTAYNLDVWFTTWKQTLIDLGFGREKLPHEKGDGEVIFFPGQLRRIGNMDETDGSLDDTTGQRGGRPPMTFMAPDICGGGTSVNKSGYTSTIICGSNAAGEPYPPHFQLKSMAQTDEGQRLSVEWFRHSKNVIARHGFPIRMSLPCTFGMNEKAGMNSVELDKYMKNSIVPLYPDLEDVPGKRIIVKCDSGPGRMNIEMLADLRMLGVYLVPSVPNTTAKTQETDQNYGVYKSSFRANLRLLSQGRFERGLSLKVTDLPLLVFGGKCIKTDLELRDAFSDAFSIQNSLKAWSLCGAVPLTRLPLTTKDIRREIPVGDAAALVGDDDDIEVSRLRNLEVLNHFHCDVLNSNGYDGNQLRREAPKRTTYVAVTEPQSDERIEAIMKAKTAGQLFFATGGRHINTVEFFKAKERLAREIRLKSMEDEKTKHLEKLKAQNDAVALIRNRGDLTYSNEKKFTVAEIKTLLKWKKTKPESTKKKDLIDAYIKAPKPAKPTKVWTKTQEAALVLLQSTEVDIKDTALGVAATQMARALGNNVAQLNPESRAALRETLRAYEEDNGPNVL